jgi:hypothetical protein
LQVAGNWNSISKLVGGKDILSVGIEIFSALFSEQRKLKTKQVSLLL